MSSNFQQHNIAQSVFQKHYEQLPESQKELINQKYNCSICFEIIKYENPYLCYKCQKIFHHSCLKCWSDKQKILNKNLSCPNCRNELPLDEWNVKRNHDEERTKDAEILNQIGKSFNRDKYINTSKELFHFILQRFNVIHPLINSQKNYKLNNLIEEFNSKLINPSIDEISTAIMEEINIIEEFINNSQKGKKNEVIQHKNEINLIYKCENEGNETIFDDCFVKKNKDNIRLIINGKHSPLVSNWRLKKGENNITICIKNKLRDLTRMFYFCKSLYNIEELKYLNTEDVISFQQMFSSCNISDLKPLENWNTSKSENFFQMFLGLKFLTNVDALKNWNVSNCKNFDGMFNSCKNLTNIKGLENWNVSSGINFSDLFQFCENLKDIKPLENWNVSNGIKFERIFAYCKSLSDIESLKNWNVLNAINLNNFFEGAKNQILNHFKIGIFRNVNY